MGCLPESGRQNHSYRERNGITQVASAAPDAQGNLREVAIATSPNPENESFDKLNLSHLEFLEIMESVIYILLLAATLALLFFAIAFRETPKIGK